MKKFFIIFFSIIFSIIFLFILYILLFGIRSVKKFDSKPRIERVYEESRARYFTYYIPTIFVFHPDILEDECSFEDAKKNENYIKAWYNENDKVIRIEFSNYKKEKILKKSWSTEEYYYNDKGIRYRATFLDKDDNVIRTYPSSNIFFMLTYDIVKGMGF